MQGVVILLIGTLENVRLREGDRVVVSIGAATYEAEVVDSSDMAKIKIRLDTGSEVWIGCRCVVDLVNNDCNAVPARKTLFEK